jgi:NAD(P)-dependent dehydrogenase (short-subunit alcohol dehydrogenase family)
MKRVFLTGASSAIGPAIALSLLAQGDEVDIALAEAARCVKVRRIAE